MAYKQQSEQRLLELEHNSAGEYIYVTLVEGNYKSYDVRTFYTDAGGEIRPTKKGVRMRTEEAVEVLGAIIHSLEDSDREALKKLIEEYDNPVETEDGADTEEDEDEVFSDISNDELKEFGL